MSDRTNQTMPGPTKIEGAWSTATPHEYWVSCMWTKWTNLFS